MTKGTKIAIALALGIPLLLLGGAVAVAADQLTGSICRYESSERAVALATAGNGDGNPQSLLCGQVVPDSVSPLRCGLEQNRLRVGHRCECPVVDGEFVVHQVWGQCGEHAFDGIRCVEL